MQIGGGRPVRRGPYNEAPRGGLAEYDIGGAPILRRGAQRAQTRLQLKHDVAQPLTFVFVLKPLRNPERIRIRHKDQIPRRNAEVGGEARALGAKWFLRHLHQDFLTFVHGLLDRHVAPGGLPTLLCRYNVGDV